VLKVAAMRISVFWFIKLVDEYDGQCTIQT